MKQLCPYCGKLVEIPETAAGSETVCSNCGKTFGVPKSFVPSVPAAAALSQSAAAAATPAFAAGPPTFGASTAANPPVAADTAAAAHAPHTTAAHTVLSAAAAPTAAAAHALSAASAPNASGVLNASFSHRAPTGAAEPSLAPDGSREVSLTLDSRFMAWLPALGLSVALLSVLFFSWIGSFPAGYRAFAQSPIQALFASYTGNTFAALQAEDKLIESTIRTDWLMLPMHLALVAAVALAWLERIFPNPTLENLPAPVFWLVNYHPWRHWVLISLTILSLGLLVLQVQRGFGLEQAAHRAARSVLAKEIEQADTPFARQEVEIRVGQEFGKFCIDDTLASDIGLLALTVALLALIVRWRLDRRGSKPPPRLILRY